MHLLRALLLGLTLTGGVAAQIPPPQIQKADVEQGMRAVEASALPQVDKDAALKAWQEAMARLDEADRSRSQALEFDRLVEEAPKALAATERELQTGVIKPRLTPAPTATLQELELELRQAEAAQQTAQKELTELEQESTQRTARLKSLPAEIANQRSELAKAEESLSATTAPAPEDLLKGALYGLQLARREALRQGLHRLESEQASYTGRSELLPKRLAMVRLRITNADRLRSAWEEVVSARRKAEADRAAEEAHQLVQRVSEHPEARRIAAETSRLAELLSGPSGLSTALDDAEKQLAATRSRLDELRRSAISVRGKLQLAGLTDATGLLLRREYRSLPSLRELRRAAATREERITDYEYQRILLEEEQPTAPVDERVARLLERVSSSQAERRRLEPAVRSLIVNQDELREKVLKLYGDITTRLWQLDAVAAELTQKTTAYSDFILERILWVRSVAKGRPPSLSEMVQSLRWLLAPQPWITTADGVGDAFSRAWPGMLGVALLVALLWVMRRWMRRRLRDTGVPVAKLSTDSFRHTLRALLWTALVAAPLPVTVWALSLLPRWSTQGAEVALAAADGLLVAASFLLPLSLLHAALLPRGLCEVHLRWPKQVAQVLRWHLRWYVPLGTICVFLVGTGVSHGQLSQDDPPGRVAFIVGAIALAVALHRTMRPNGPALGVYLARETGNWLFGTRWLWFTGILLLPVSLAIAASLGYYYTARSVEARLHQTIWFLLALVLVYALLLRWWFIARRRLALQQAKQRAEAKARETEERKTESGLAMDAEVDESQVDLSSLHVKTRQLFRAGLFLASLLGLYGIWYETLPALRIFDRFQIWPTISIVDDDAQRMGAPDTIASPLSSNATAPRSDVTTSPPPPPPRPTLAADATGATAPVPGTVVTLGDLGLSVIFLMVTWLLARSLPALLEITLLPRLPIDAGTRYAITTLFRYLVVVVGVLATFGAVGIGWSQVQWLVAALTFGLAFGLQEIFANFISGLIILAERPVRVGDVVTVGNVTGYVTRIRMRATTITDWDRKELLVPNKEFVTTQLVNWTLSDPITRVTIPVGIAYGSDTDRAAALLLEIAAASPSVLEQPRPVAAFLGFGDSTLNFELRVFVGQLDNRVPLIHELHTAIHKRFAEAGIEIAFPQRDLHIRSASPIAEVIDRAIGLKEKG